MKKVGSFSALLGGDPARRLAGGGFAGGGAAGGGPRKFAPKVSSAPSSLTARVDVDEGGSSDIAESDFAAPLATAKSDAITADVATPISSEKSRPQSQSEPNDFNIMQLMSPSDASWFPETYLGTGRMLSSASPASADAPSYFSSATASALPAATSIIKPIIRSVPKVVAAKSSGLAAVVAGGPGAHTTADGAMLGTQRPLSNPTPIIPRPAKVVTIGSSMNHDKKDSGAASNDLVDSILGISKPPSSHHGQGGPTSSFGVHGRRDQQSNAQIKKRSAVSGTEDAARPKAPRLLPSQPASLFPFAASSSSSNSSAGGAVAPYLLMGASSLGSHAAHDSHSSFAVSSSATRTRRRKKSISSSSAHTHSGAFPFMFDGLDDNDVGSSGALASLPATYPFAAASVSAPSLHSGDARAVGFATHTVYLRKKEGGIGLKLKNVGGRAVIRGFSEEYLDNLARSGQIQQLQVNDVVLSVNHLDAQTASFDSIVDAFRWVPPSSDWCGLRASNTQAETLRKRRRQQQQSDASEKNSSAPNPVILDETNSTEVTGPDDTTTAALSVNSTTAAPMPEFLPVASAEDELMAAYPVSLSRVEDVLCVKVLRGQRQTVHEARLI